MSVGSPFTRGVPPYHAPCFLPSRGVRLRVRYLNTDSCCDYGALSCMHACHDGVAVAAHAVAVVMHPACMVPVLGTLQRHPACAHTPGRRILQAAMPSMWLQGRAGSSCGALCDAAQGGV